MFYGRRKRARKTSEGEVVQKRGNVITEIDGVKFRSRKEARRYVVLKEEQEQGLISNLRLQPRYKFRVRVWAWDYQALDDECLEELLTYVSDFEYIKDGILITEEVKGWEDSVWKRKKKLFLALYKSLTLLVTR